MSYQEMTYTVPVVDLPALLESLKPGVLSVRTAFGFCLECTREQLRESIQDPLWRATTGDKTDVSAEVYFRRHSGGETYARVDPFMARFHS